MWPRFQRGQPLLLDGKTQNGAARANASGTGDKSPMRTPATTSQTMNALVQRDCV